MVPPTTTMCDDAEEENNVLRSARPSSPSSSPSPASSASTLVDIDLDDDDDVDNVDAGGDGNVKKRTASVSKRGSIQASILDSIERFSKKYSIRKPRSWSSVSRFEVRDPGFGLVNLFALKVLFVDALISLGDVASDFAQGLALVRTDGLEVFGFITVAINWLPGVVAAVHLVSMYRTRHHYKWILLWAVLLLVFYPVVPLFAYLNLLWKHPKGKSKLSKHRQEFKESEYLAAIAHSIAGGIESPMQFILQMWLILNGKIARPWDQVGSLTVRDWHGNEVHLPTTAAISLTFSLASIAKAVIDFNIIRVHIEDVSSARKVLQGLELIFSHLPFLASAAFFRVATIILLLTYVNAFAFLPVAIFWFCCLAIGYRSFNLEKIPLWLISFISLFFPICFTTHPVTIRNRHKMVSLQYKTFLQQSYCCAAVYLPSLVFCFYKVNFDPTWAYDPNVIMNNLEFNVAVAAVCATGVLASLLAVSPNWMDCIDSWWSRRQCESFDMQDAKITVAITDASGKPTASSSWLTPASVEKSVEKPPFPPPTVVLSPQTSNASSNFENSSRLSRSELASSCLRSAMGLLVLVLVLTPAVAPLVMMQMWRPQEAYVAYSPAVSHTKIIQAIPLTHSWRQDLLKGCLQVYDVKTREEPYDFQYPICTHGILLRVERDDWQYCYDSACYKDASAVVIVDGRPDPARRTGKIDPSVQGHNTFRPSYPSGDIKLVQGLPMVLVQSVDSDWLFPSVTSCLTRPCDIALARTRANLPPTEFKCDASHQKHIPYDEHSSLIDPITRMIRGRQYRTISCHWGEQSCLGWKQRGRKEWQDFCDGPDIRKFFRSNGFDWNFDFNPDKKTRRIIHGRGSTQPHNLCRSEANIARCDSCDSGTSGGASGWSKWLRCDRTDSHNFIRKRYCEVSPRCILQEKREGLSEEECLLEDLPRWNTLK